MLLLLEHTLLETSWELTLSPGVVHGFAGCPRRLQSLQTRGSQRSVIADTTGKVPGREPVWLLHVWVFVGSSRCAERALALTSGLCSPLSTLSGAQQHPISTITKVPIAS